MEDEVKQKQKKKWIILAVILAAVLIFAAALYLRGRDADKSTDSSNTAETDESETTEALSTEEAASADTEEEVTTADAQEVTKSSDAEEETAASDAEEETTTAGAEEETAQAEGTAQDASGDDEIALPLLNVTLTVVDITDGVVTVQIDNQSGEVFTYYDSFVLEREENGEWITVPFLEDAVFNEIAYELSDLCAHTKEYDLFAYCGELEAGNYRITISDISAEFTLS